MADDNLNEIPIETLDEARQAALLRLHLLVTAETTRLLDEYAKGVKGLLLDAAGEEGTLDAVAGFSLVTEAEQRWHEVFNRWQTMFEAARWQAAALAFGALARGHQAMFGAAEGALQEGQQQPPPTFEPQLQELLDAAAGRVYGDGFNLSGRIWRLGQDGLDGIRRTLLAGIAGGDSAWDLGRGLEDYLGAGSECPRWTSTRLYELTKKQIAAGDRRGLISSVKGTPCETKGVAYKALRLARNEIQIIHHAAFDEILSRVPWVEMVQIVLSPDHPDIGCECEDVVAGGENGDGVYPKGQITLPIHVQCLCNKLAVLMEADAFTDKLRDWMAGTAAWSEMDAYAGWLDVGSTDLLESSLLVSWGTALLTWLWGDEDALKGALDLLKS